MKINNQILLTRPTYGRLNKIQTVITYKASVNDSLKFN